MSAGSLSSALRALLACAVLAIASGAQAGRGCAAAGAPRAADVLRAMTLAERTARWLDASGAQVVVLARVGQDLSRYGQHYSHLGLAYREGSGWRVAHKLNHCGSAQAAIYRQGLGEFFLDDLHDYQAGVAVLAPGVQASLLPALRDNVRLAQLHTPRYSMVAYPWSQRYQQSNQWALETLAMMHEPAAFSRERAQGWLRLQDYRPDTLHLSPLARVGARVGTANVAFDDHPAAKRFSDRIETVTADSVFAWLARSGFGQPVQVVR